MPPTLIVSFGDEALTAGAVAVMAKTAAAPLERLKLLRQTEDELIRRGVIESRMGTVVQTLRSIVATEGVAGLWRSNLTNCIRYFPTQGLNFAFRALYSDSWLLRKDSDDRLGVKAVKNIIGGGAAGATSSLFVYHLDFARTRLAADVRVGGSQSFKNLPDVYRQVLRSDGVLGMYRGFVPGLLGIFIYRGASFGLFDTIVPLVPESFAARFVVGYFVTISASLMAYPIDTVRRRAMIGVGNGKATQSIWRSAIDIYRNQGGVPTLFKGAGINIVRSLAGASVLSGVDQINRWRGKTSRFSEIGI